LIRLHLQGGGVGIGSTLVIPSTIEIITWRAIQQQEEEEEKEVLVRGLLNHYFMVQITRCRNTGFSWEE